MFWRLGFLRVVFGPCLRTGIDRFNGVDRNHLWRREQQFAGAGDVLGSLAAGEQAIVTNAVEACGQHMDQKAADELAGRKRHGLVTLRPFDPVVLPFEGDALVVDQTPVGDGDPVSVAGEIAQDFLGSAEWGLAVDVPFAVAQRRQIGAEGFRVGQLGKLAEEPQFASRMSDDELLKEQPAE